MDPSLAEYFPKENITIFMFLVLFDFLIYFVINCLYLHGKKYIFREKNTTEIQPSVSRKYS